ncbi:MAG: ComEC/Rec2 family competence protein [Spirochaetaceae bacterium]|jgi:competence protein ComEC|nr:ComEC/Rec2 family competence protein [Spirochaetaceae bacterium]
MRIKKIDILVKIPPIVAVCSGAVFSFYGFKTCIQNGLSNFITASILCALACISALFVLRKKINKLLFLLLVCFFAGIICGIAGRTSVLKENFVSLGQVSENVTGLTGILRDDPRTSSSGNGMGTVGLIQSLGKNGIRTSARGNILVFFPEGSIPRLKEFGRNSVIFVDGNFSVPKNGTSDIKIFRAKSTHIYKSAPFLDRLRTQCRLAVVDVFSAGKEKWGGLALALLLGIRDNLDSDLAKQYQNAGCSYILALSGMHLAIISAVLAFLLTKPLGKIKGTVLSAVFIFLYVYIVGDQPSLTRSAIMYMLGTFAVVCAFPKSPAILLALSFLLQIFYYSAQGDTISFILSYLALAGILSVGPALTFIGKGKIPDIILSPLSASLGAFLATVSICILFFGELAPGGIAAGLLLAPLTTVFMVLAMGYLFFAFTIPVLNIPLKFVMSLVYTFLDRIAAFFGKFPSLKLAPDFFVMSISILLPLSIILLALYTKRKRHFIELEH